MHGESLGTDQVNKCYNFFFNFERYEQITSCSIILSHQIRYYCSSVSSACIGCYCSILSSPQVSYCYIASHQGSYRCSNLLEQLCLTIVVLLLLLLSVICILSLQIRVAIVILSFLLFRLGIIVLSLLHRLAILLLYHFFLFPLFLLRLKKKL